MSKYLIPIFPPAVVYLLNFILLLGPNYYEVYSNTDNIMHFLGGASIFVMSYLAIYKTKIIDKLFLKLSQPLKFLFFISFVALFVVSWEIYEFCLDWLFGTNTQPSLIDTVTDMVMGMLGGIVTIVLFFFSAKQ